MKRRLLFVCMGVSLVALCVPVFMTMPIAVVYNPNDSVSQGWYRVGGPGDAESLHVSSIVLARIPVDAVTPAGHELFLLSDTNPASFDGRYFGPIGASAVLGVASPLWTLRAP